MTETVAQIDGMMCSMCESHINDLIRREFKVKKVTSSHKTGEAVIISEQGIDGQALGQALKNMGYELKSIESHPYVKKGLFGRVK